MTSTGSRLLHDILLVVGYCMTPTGSRLLHDIYW